MPPRTQHLYRKLLRTRTMAPQSHPSKLLHLHPGSPQTRYPCTPGVTRYHSKGEPLGLEGWPRAPPCDPHRDLSTYHGPSPLRGKGAEAMKVGIRSFMNPAFSTASAPPLLLPEEATAPLGASPPSPLSRVLSSGFLVLCNTASFPGRHPHQLSCKGERTLPPSPQKAPAPVPVLLEVLA